METAAVPRLELNGEIATPPPRAGARDDIQSGDWSYGAESAVSPPLSLRATPKAWHGNPYAEIRATGSPRYPRLWRGLAMIPTETGETLGCAYGTETRS